VACEAAPTRRTTLIGPEKGCVKWGRDRDLLNAPPPGKKTLQGLRDGAKKRRRQRGRIANDLNTRFIRGGISGRVERKGGGKGERDLKENKTGAGIFLKYARSNSMAKS